MKSLLFTVMQSLLLYSALLLKNVMNETSTISSKQHYMLMEIDCEACFKP